VHRLALSLLHAVAVVAHPLVSDFCWENELCV
jgi:hypothetical protein